MAGLVKWCWHRLQGGLAIVILLALTLCAAEVGLRLHDVLRETGALESNTVREPDFLPSSLTYATLAPHSILETRRPDGEVIQVRLNSYACRGNEPEIPKPGDCFRIMLLGGQRLLARESADHEHCAARLMELLQPRCSSHLDLQVAALPAGSMETAYIQLEHQLSALQPDLILLLIDPDSLLQMEAQRRWLRRDPQGRPLSCCHPTQFKGRRSEIANCWRQEFQLVDRIMNAAGAPLMASSFDEASAVPTSAGITPPLVADAVKLLPGYERLVAQWGGRLVVWSVPTTHYPGQDWGASLTQEIEATGTLWCDVTLMFPDPTAQQSWYAHDGAWTAIAHEQFGDALASYLTARVAGPWNSTSSGTRAIEQAGHHP